MQDTSLQPSFPVSKTDRIDRKTRILIVDDQQFVRRMLTHSLEQEAGFEIVGLAESGAEALQCIEALQPDIALVDVEMPNMDGITLTQHISDRAPKTKVLVLSMHDEDAYIRRALQAGAKGYLLKNTPAEELSHAIRFVMRGYLQLGPGLYEKLERDANSLLIHFPGQALQNTDSVLPVVAPSVPLAEVDRLEVDAMDIAWDDWTVETRELVETLPKPWTRGFIYIVLLLTVIILPWSAFAEVEEVGTAKGRLEPRGQTIRLDSPVEGTVAQIYVKEGQTVQKGQLLMALKTDLVDADVQQEQVKQEGFLNRQTQLMMIKTQLESSLSSARQQFQSQANSQLAEVRKVEQQQETLQDAVKLTQTLLTKDQEKITNLRNLANQGVIPRTQVDDAERIMIQNQQQLQKTLGDIKQVAAERQKQVSAYQKILEDEKVASLEKQKQIQEVISQMTDLQSERSQSLQRVRSLRLQQKQRSIYAATSGVIFQLPIQHPGAVMKVGDPVAQIAPKAAKLILRAQMATKDAGFIQKGLPVKLKFDAYPFQDYGIVPGTLSWIAPNSTVATPTPTSSPTQSTALKFDLEVELAQLQITAKGRSIQLQSGQTATADVVVRKRRVLDIFLDPFRQLKKGGLQL
jgi:hemolysin D